jgi:hypothetical protein
MPLGSKPGVLYVTMSPGQWDRFLEAAYEDGCVLLEVEGFSADGDPVRAFRREVSGDSQPGG